MTKIIAIDIGITNNGFAILEKNNVVMFSSLNLESSDSLQNKYSKIYNFFSSLVKKHNITRVIYEEPQRVPNRNIEKQLLKVCGLFEAISIEHNLEDCLSYNPTTVKKKITGNAKAKKEEIKQKVEEKLKIKISNAKDHHSIDALALGLIYFFSSNEAS